MKLPLPVAPLLAAALLALVVANTVAPNFEPIIDRGLHRFEVRLGSTGSGVAQLFYNTGRGFNEADSALARVDPGPPRVLVFPLKAESIRDLRFDTINNDATVTLEEAIIRRPDGTVLKRFHPADIVPFNQIESLTRQGQTVTVKPLPGAGDPHVRILLGVENLPLVTSWFGMLRPFLVRALPWFALFAGAWAGWAYLGGRWHAPARARLTALRGWLGARPKTAVALAAALAMVLSSYPVIFCGASFVSPNYGANLLYDAFPTLPGSRAADVVDVRGADIGAIMWQQVPESAIQSRALLRDFELPLWNRYNSGGTVLLGQGQTMFGDPLHLGVVLAGGAAWAWDLKYLAAKWLLGLGLGLTVWHTARHLGAALIVAFASIFVGFFVFRVNHPAFFSFCYGPLVLYAWCHVTGAATRRGLGLALLGLMGANWMLLTSGTAKEAYVSLLTLNFAGALVLVCSENTWRERWRRLGAAAMAGLLFVLISAPIWLTFRDAMKASYSSYNAAFAFQLQPSLALGFFDELLLRPFWEEEKVFNPSSNFLLLLGVLAFLVNLREITGRNRYALGAGLAALVPAAFVFGLVPPTWIAAWPILGNVHHIDNSFGIGLIHLFAVLAGFGFASAARRLGGPEGRGDLAVAGLLLGALVLHYLGFTQVVQRSTYSYHKWGQSVPLSYVVWAGFLALLLAAAGLAFAVRRTLLRQRLGAALLFTLSACTVVLLWRHGLQLRSLYPNHTLNAAPRADFAAPSPALQAIAADAREPARAAGFQSHFFPGWHDVYGLEGVNGPDALINPHMRELQTAFAVARVWDWRLVLFPEKFAHDRPFYDLMNVRYYLNGATEPAPMGAGLTLLTRADLAVWRSETAWPRAFFTDRVATYQTAADFAALVRNGDHRPLAAVQSSDRELPPLPRGELASRTVVPATSYKLTTNTTSFLVNATSAGVIVLGEAWLPKDFIVTINGRPAPYFRVNHAFKGVYVPQGGTYAVSFRYRPRNFNLALGLCLLGLGATGAASYYLLRRTPPPAAA